MGVFVTLKCVTLENESEAAHKNKEHIIRHISMD